MGDPPSQLKLFGPKPVIDQMERDLSRLGLTRREATSWRHEGFLSFDPNRVPALEQWMFDEVVFVRDLRRVEWSLNARRLLARLKRPYAYSHGELFSNFREMRSERRYRFYEIKTAIFENPEAAVEGACGLIRGVADFGTRDQLLKILAEVQRVVDEDNTPR